MTQSIQCERRNPLEDPTILSVSIDQDIPSTARYYILLTASTSGREITVPTGKSYLIRNAGSNAFDIATSGPGKINLQAGDELRVSWDPDTAAHTAARLPAADSAVSGSSTDPIQNSVIKSYIDAAIAGVEGMAVVDDFDDLRAFTTPTELVYVKGRTAVEDGGGGLFQWLGASGSAAHDDGGWHIVATAGSDGTRNIWGRLSDVITPQMFGAVGYATQTAARAGSDQATAFQNAVNFWADPTSFGGYSSWATFRKSLRFEVPAGLYPCESTITIHPPDSGQSYEYENYYVPGEFVMSGAIFTPDDVEIPAIKIRQHRTGAKPRLVLRAYKDRNPSTGRVTWDYGSYPGRFLDDTALRSWASSTAFYRDEEIKYTISSIVYVFKCTQSGTTSTTAPTDVTGTEFTDGTAKFTCAGSCRLANGKSMNDMLADNRDIGIQIDNSWEHGAIICSTWNYCVGIALYPRGAVGSAVGWSTIQADHIHDSMVGVLVASYLGERMMSAGGRLTLSSFPIGGMVWETTYPGTPSDAGTKYRFNGPAGGESTPANWTVDTDWSAVLGANPNWCNDNKLNLQLAAPYAQGAGIITGNKSQYGVVFTSFGPSYGNNNNAVQGLALENNPFSKTALNESTQVLFYTGSVNRCQARNETPNKTAAVLVPVRILPSDQARLNRVDSCRVGKHVSDLTYRLSGGGGYGNLLTDAPYDEGSSAEKTVIFSQQLSFSSYTKVYARDLTFVHRTTTATADYQNWALHRTAADAEPPIYYPLHDAWGFSSRYLPAVMIDLTNDDMNLAVIRMEPIFASDETLGSSRYFRFMAYAMNADGITRLDPTLWPSPPFQSVDYLGGLTQPYTSATYRWIYPIANQVVHKTMIFGARRFVKKVLLGMFGEYVRGFRVQVIGCGSASIYSPFHSGLAGGLIDNLPLIDAVPEKGRVQSPCTFRFRDGSGTYHVANLNKAAGPVYYCTSDLTTDIGSPVKYQWGHSNDAQGSATIYEWDGDSWEAIATNAYFTEPTDFESFDLST